MSRIFPGFRKLCLEREVVFTEIDLRWGITQEAANNGRTVQICLEEIDRCRSLQLPPFFIGFLGERYGWVPTHTDLLHYWEQEPNAAYAQEIQSALARGISVTELEIRFGFLDGMPDATASRVLMLLRDPVLTEKIAQESNAKDFYESQNRAALQSLKAVVRQAASSKKTALVDDYESLNAFGEAIHIFLVEQLDALFPKEKVPDPLLQQCQLHDSYAASRLRTYVPRTAQTNQLKELFELTDGPAGVMIQGSSGSGKSAFVASFAQQLSQKSSVLVLQHFLAAEGTPRLTLWRDRLMQTLQAQGWINHPIPETEHQRWLTLPTWLNEVAQLLGQRICIVLDALDQASDLATSLPIVAELSWGPNVFLLTTATPDVQAPDQWSIFPILPFDREERWNFVQSYLDYFAKQLPDAMLQSIVMAPASDTPLYLKTVLEEARLRSSHASLGQDIERWLGHPDTGSLFLDALRALDQDYALHAPALASRATRYMAAAMHGITQHDLAKLLAPAGFSQLPDQILLALLANLQPYILQNQGRLQLQHSSLKEATEQDRLALKKSRQELLAHHQSEDAPSQAEALYQVTRLQLTAIEDDLRMGIIDPSSPFQTFEDYLRHDEEQKNALLENTKDLPTFIKIWQWDSNVSYNYLQLLGAGKAWQPENHQTQMLRYWMESLESVDTASLLKLPLDELTLWFDQMAMVYLCRTYAIHLLEFKKKHLSDQPEDLAFSATIAAQMLLRHGSGCTQEYVQAQQWIDLALNAWKKIKPDSEAGTPTQRDGLIFTLLQQATLYWRQDNYSQALELIQETLQLQNSMIQGFNSRTCDFLNLRSKIYAHFEDFDQAIVDADLSRKMRIELEGPVHADVAQSLNLMGTIRLIEEKIETAYVHLSQCCAMTRQTKLEFHPDLGFALHNLAIVHEKKGDLDTAIALYEESRLCWQQHLPPGDPRRNLTFENLALLYQERGAIEEEKAILESLLLHCSLPIPGSFPAPDATVLTRARTHLRLAQIHVQQCKADEAQKHWVQGLYHLRSRALEAEEEPLIARTREMMGSLACVSFVPKKAYASIQFIGFYQKNSPSLMSLGGKFHER